MKTRTIVGLGVACLIANAVACGTNDEPGHDSCEADAGGSGSAGAPSSQAGAKMNEGGGGHDSAGAPGLAGNSAESGAGGGDTGPRPGKLRALTFNAAMAPGFEPLTAERKPKLEAALAAEATEIDVLCVQEYWDDADFDDLADAVAADLPHRYRQPAKPGSGSCTLEELTGLGGCLEAQCKDAAGPELIVCAQTECAPHILSMSGGCLGCMLEHVADKSFEECYAVEPAPDDPALFGGAYDVGLLSRYPLLEQHALLYDAYFVRASALHARVELPDLGPVDAFCTHLGSSIGIIPYHGPHGSWAGEHSYQTAQLLGFISAHSNGDQPIVVLGDLNTGPEGAGPPVISPELPFDYQLLLAAGFNQALTPAACTMCPDNVLRAGDPRAIFVDHALTKHFTGTVSASRTLEQTFMLGSGDSAMPMSLSDHYGVKLTLHGE